MSLEHIRTLRVSAGWVPRAVLLAVLFAAGGLGCVAPRREPPPWSEAEYPGTLREPESLDVEVLWRQRVTATWGEDGRRSFDAAVQRQGDRLTVLGLSPLGVGFVLTLQDGEISFENRTGEELPFPPRFVLLDVQRVFYPWLPPGVTEGEVDGEWVEERREGGRLLERSFRREAGDVEGEIVVRYSEYREGAVAPRVATLSNGWFGYRLEVVTLGEERLAGGAEAADRAPGG